MKFFLLLMGFFLCQISLAQIKVSGTVTDEKGDPLPYANVIVYERIDTLIVMGTITDDEGKFALDIKEPRAYRVELSSLGYETRSFIISESTDLGTVLLVASQVQLDEIEVIGSKPLLQRKNNKLILNVGDNVANLGNSMLEILQKSPGVMVDQNNTILLNGRSGVRVFVDGKDTRLSGNALGDLLNNIRSTAIDHIEIIQNPSAKYEAQGNAGIINIITKKGKLQGTNGSITMSSGFGRYFRLENSLNINHRRERYNIYGQYTLAKRDEWLKVEIDRLFLNENNNIRSRVRLDNVFKTPNESHSLKVGFDYGGNDGLRFGFQMSGLFNDEQQNGISLIGTSDRENKLVLDQETNSNNATYWDSYTGNGYSQYAFKNGSTLDFDVDLAHYRNQIDQNFVSSLLNLENGTFRENRQTGVIGTRLQILGLSSDYKTLPNDFSQIQTGYKFVGANSSNSVRYNDFVAGQDAPVGSVSNSFEYVEHIHGIYVNYSNQRKKWGLDIGLRSEYTDTQGAQHSSDVRIKRSYLDLFPSMSVNHSIGEEQDLAFSIGRRIDRPVYHQLNPFRLNIDTNTFTTGEPNLRPQYTWSTETSYNVKGKYFISLSYAVTTDFITEAAIQDESRQEVLLKPINIDDVKTISLNMNVPLKLGQWLQSNINVSSSWSKFTGVISGAKLDRWAPRVNVNSSTNFSCGNGYKLFVNTFHLFSHYSGITELETISSISFGARKSFLKGRADVSINVNDLFWNQYPVGQTDFALLIDNFRSYRDTRYIMMGLTYKFGNASIASERKRRSQIQKEKDRARQQRL